MSYGTIALIIGTLMFAFYMAAIYSDRLRKWALCNGWVLFGMTETLHDLDRGFEPGDNIMFLALFLQILISTFFAIIFGLFWPIGIPMLLFFKLSVKKFTR